MQIITSKDNENKKSIEKLKKRKYRNLNKEYIIGGIKILKEAIQERAVIKKIVICEECLANNIIDEKLLYEIAKYDCLYVSKKIFEGLTDVSKPQGILAVVEKNNKKDINYNEDIIVALDGLQDPGNLGTILRTLDSANLTQVIVSKDTVDAYNPKVVRSTMGAIFRVNIVEAENLKETLKEMKRHKYKVMCTDLTASKNIYEIDYNKKILVIGNEANGISKELLEIADEKIIIPMLGKTESLNASVATSIIVYEYVRRKIGIRGRSLNPYIIY